MTRHLVHGFVITAVTIASAPVLNHAQAPPDTVITDPDAYAVYAAVLPTYWKYGSSKGALLLQQETADVAAITRCVGPKSGRPRDPEWDPVEEAFNAANAHVHLLQPALPIDMPYRLIARADIEADDARLAQKYPGTWNRLPESKEYAAVSAVGFNAARTKAILYVHLRGQGTLFSQELREGLWKPARRNGCGWII